MTIRRSQSLQLHNGTEALKIRTKLQGGHLYGVNDAITPALEAVPVGAIPAEVEGRSSCIEVEVYVGRFVINYLSA